MPRIKKEKFHYAPYPPQKPREPEEYIDVKTKLESFYDGTIVTVDYIRKYLDDFLDGKVYFEASEDYYEDDGGSEFGLFKTEKVLNKKYKQELKKYEKDLIKYNAEFAQYELDLVDYEEWNLQNQINTLEKVIKNSKNANLKVDGLEKVLNNLNDFKKKNDKV